MDDQQQLYSWGIGEEGQLGTPHNFHSTAQTIGNKKTKSGGRFASSNDKNNNSNSNNNNLSNDSRNTMMHPPSDIHPQPIRIFAGYDNSGILVLSGTKYNFYQQQLPQILQGENQELPI